jgi:hypothetical protein
MDTVTVLGPSFAIRKEELSVPSTKGGVIDVYGLIADCQVGEFSRVLNATRFGRGPKLFLSVLSVIPY